MDIQKLRQDRGWSQEQIAEMAGLSTRTVQRIENGAAASAETLKSLAAVFDIPLNQLQKSETGKTFLNPAERRVLGEIRALRIFYIHLFFFVLVNVLLFVINFITWSDYFWAIWPLLGWGVGILIHGVTVIRPLRNFGTDWERREFEKRMRDRNS